MTPKSIYVIGSLRNPRVPEVANELRDLGFSVFDDWYAAGPKADDHWQEYEQQRGRDYELALNGAACWNVFGFDKSNLDEADLVLLVAPAGKSGHLELGYCIGRGAPGYILFDKEPERWDVMLRFADEVFFSVERMKEYMKIRWLNL